MRTVRPRELTRRPHITVVVPCYRYGRYLDNCVRSVVSQTGVSTRVLIIDDASPDDSFVQARTLSNRYRNVEAQRNEVNLGHIATYNKGLKQADSDYVVLLSADDLLAPGALRRATALMEAHPTVGLTYGQPLNFVEPPKFCNSRARTWSLWRGEAWIRAQFRRGLSILYSPEAIVRTTVQHQVGYYNRELPHSADLEMWLRIARVSDVGRVNGAIQAYRRIHPDSMMNTRFGTLLSDLVERHRTYQGFLEHEGAGFLHTESLSHSVAKRLSLEALAWATTNLGDASEEDIEAAVAFARNTYPDYERLPGWREFIYARKQSRPTIRLRVEATVGKVTREVGDRLRWRRWVHLGI